MKKTKPKTSAERVADFERRQRERGLRKIWLWVHPGDRQAVRDYAAALIDERRRRSL